LSAAKKFGQTKPKRSWYDFVVKQNIVFLFVISAAVLSGCKQDSNPPGNSETPAAAATVTNAPPQAAAPINLPAEIARAKAENKMLLLEFGSSDSCPPCILFEQTVFSTPEFLDYEKSNLVFVRLDYPVKTQLPPDIQATNVFLAQQFEAFAFPTFIALDANGKEFWRMPGKNDLQPAIDTSLFSPKNFIALLDSVKAKEK
jgi:thioredoxin-related protein